MIDFVKKHRIAKYIQKYYDYLDGAVMKKQPRGRKKIRLIIPAVFLIITFLYCSCGRAPVFTWESRAFPEIKGRSGSGVLCDVQFINNAFYAVGESCILSSPDGKQWRVAHRGDCYYNAISYGGGLLVAVGGCNKSNGVIFSSADGDHWEEITVPGIKSLSAVAYGAGRFVAVGYDTTVVLSLNGKALVPRESGLSKIGRLNNVAFGRGLFVTTGQAGTIVTSPDGSSWTRRKCDTRRDLYGITYGDGRFVAVSSDFWFFDVRAFVSSDGISWKAEDTDCKETLRGVSYGGGVFVAVGGNYRSGGRGNIDFSQLSDKGCTVFTSRNGRSWRKNECSAGRQLYGVAFGKNSFVAVGRGIILQSGPVR